MYFKKCNFALSLEMNTEITTCNIVPALCSCLLFRCMHETWKIKLRNILARDSVDIMVVQKPCVI